MPRKLSSFLDTLMHEVILYGGLPVRRGDVYADALARTGSKRVADLFAFGPRAIALDGVEPISRSDLDQPP